MYWASWTWDLSSDRKSTQNQHPTNILMYLKCILDFQIWFVPQTFQIYIRFLPLNLPKIFKRNIVSPPNSSYFLYDTIKLVQFYICYYFAPPTPPLHKILVPPLHEFSHECFKQHQSHLSLHLFLPYIYASQSWPRLSRTDMVMRTSMGTCTTQWHRNFWKNRILVWPNTFIKYIYIYIFYILLKPLPFILC